jgi:hypothetical protein
MRRAIDALASRPEGIDVAWVGSNEAHDLRLQVAQGRIWMLPPSGQWRTEGPGITPSLAIDEPALPARLQSQLQRLGRSLNLLRIADAAQGAAADRTLQVQAALMPARGARRLIDPWQTADARDGDLVEIEVRNAGRRAVDLTALYIDADHGITVLYPHPQGASNRIEAGDREKVVARIDATTRGVERMVLIAVEAQPGDDRRDFSFLALPRLGEARGDADAVTQWFRLATFGGTYSPVHRGAVDPQTAEHLDMRVYRLDVR